MALQFPEREFQFNGQPMGQSQGKQKTRTKPQEGLNGKLPIEGVQNAILSGVPKGFEMGSVPVGDNGMNARDALGGYNRNIAGFNTGDYGGDVKARNSVKNTFGRIASRYAGVPASMDLLFQDPDFLRYFPNARRVEGGAGDKIDFGNILSDFESGTPVGVVDVGAGFDPINNTGQDWWWGPQNAMQDSPYSIPSQSLIPGNELYNQIQQSILQPDQQQGLDQNSLLALLQQLLGAY